MLVPKMPSPAFAAQGVADAARIGWFSQERKAASKSHERKYQAKFVEDPDVVAEEAMETRLTSNADLVAAKMSSVT